MATRPGSPKRSPTHMGENCVGDGPFQKAMRAPPQTLLRRTYKTPSRRALGNLSRLSSSTFTPGTQRRKS